MATCTWMISTSVVRPMQVSEIVLAELEDGTLVSYETSYNPEELCQVRIITPED